MIRWPVRAGNDSGTVVTAPAVRLSAMAGSGSVRVVAAFWLAVVAVIRMLVGTEWRPSAMTCRSMCVNVNGLARLYCSQSPAWWVAPKPGCQAVVELPSMAAAAPETRLPGSRALE